jgi:hypothetical protein
MTHATQFKITTIKKPLKFGVMWSGTAVNDGKRCLWYYAPRSRLCIQEEEPGIPNCFMNMDELPQGARCKIVNAVRSERTRKTGRTRRTRALREK